MNQSETNGGPGAAYERVDPDCMILRDHLAFDRTVLANERTVLAYARTAMAMLATGVMIIRFLEDDVVWLTVGWGTMIVGIAVGVCGAVRFYRQQRHLQSVYGNDQQQ